MVIVPLLLRLSLRLVKLRQVTEVRASFLSHLFASYTHLHSKLSLFLLNSSLTCKKGKQTNKQISLKLGLAT